MTLILELKQGYSRNCLLIGKFAIKFPRFASERQFVMGLSGILREREMYEASGRLDTLAHVYYTAPLGLFAVYRRYSAMVRPLSLSEQAELPLRGADLKIGNFASENGRVIVLDYAEGWLK